MIIILNRPQMAENVGFAARSMKNFGFTELRLVNPGLMEADEWEAEKHNKNFNLQEFLQKAEAVAKGGAEIIKTVKVFESLADCSFDIQKIYALSARRREVAKEVINLSNAVNEICEFNGNIGILFGRESNGLSNSDLTICQKIIEIEAEKEYPSINLGMSVGLVCYMLKIAKKEFKTAKSIQNLANLKEVEYGLEFLRKQLKNVNYFKVPEKEEKMMINIKNIFTRANLSETEVKTLIGIFSLIK